MPPIPPEVLATFPAPNYVNPETRGNALIISGTISLIIATIAVGVRCYARISRRRKLGVDDIFIILGWAATVSCTVTLHIATSKWGWNRHVWDIPQHWLQEAVKLAWVSRNMFNLAATFTRLSLLFFYYRLISGATWLRGFRLILHIAVAFITLMGLIALFLGVFQCNPVQAYWVSPPMKNATCRPEGVEAFIASIFYCVSDVSVLVLPIPVIWRLDLSIRKRFEVTALLAIGLIATAAGCLRTYYVWRVYFGTWDRSWAAYPVYISCCLEVNLGIICACAPDIRSLIKDYFHAREKSATHSQSSAGADSGPRNINRVDASWYRDQFDGLSPVSTNMDK